MMQEYHTCAHYQTKSRNKCEKTFSLKKCKYSFKINKLSERPTKFYDIEYVKLKHYIYFIDHIYLSKMLLK